MKKTMMKLTVAAAFALPIAAQAIIYQFNAGLSGANERPAPNASTANGVATLFYDDKSTLSLLDDTFSVAVSAFGLSSAGAATGFHIHAAATTDETASVRVEFANTPPFASFNSGGTLLVGGSNVSVVSVLPGITNGNIPATGASATNAGHPAMSFLAALQSQLAYVNVHSSTFPSGEIRGQLIQVAAIPEPETYALLLAGLGLVGFAVARRRKVGA